MTRGEFVEGHKFALQEDGSLVNVDEINIINLSKESLQEVVIYTDMLWNVCPICHAGKGERCGSWRGLRPRTHQTRIKQSYLRIPLRGSVHTVDSIVFKPDNLNVSLVF